MSLRKALLLVLDHVDYTNKACAPTEMVGAVLPVQVISLVRQALEQDHDEQACKVNTSLE